MEGGLQINKMYHFLNYLF